MCWVVFFKGYKTIWRTGSSGIISEINRFKMQAPKLTTWSGFAYQELFCKICHIIHLHSHAWLCFIWWKWSFTSFPTAARANGESEHNEDFTLCNTWPGCVWSSGCLEIKLLVGPLAPLYHPFNLSFFLSSLLPLFICTRAWSPFNQVK